MNRQTITTVIEILGGILIVGGLAMWTVPGAMIAAGALLIIAGGLAA